MSSTALPNQTLPNQPHPNQTLPGPAAAIAQSPAASKSFIFGAYYDLALFIGAPILALILGVLVANKSPSGYSFMLGQSPSRVAHIVMFMFTMAHLAVVFFRSHGNPKIFWQFPIRFTVVPLALLVAVCSSHWIMVSVIVLGVWWDVYHSSLQTFGLCRIYDMKRGNDPALGRSLDWWLNILMYCGPILAGVTLFDHIRSFESFEKLGTAFFTSVPVMASAYQRYLTWGILLVGVPYLVFYVISYMRLARQGYQISPQKIALLASTGFVSIYSWGFNSFGEAFFIMNFFHALQYFGIVWWSEKKNIQRIFGYEGVPNGARMALMMFLLLPMLFGGFALIASNVNSTILLNIQLVVSIMHFWYDSFIWSVRKKQVATA